MCFTQIEMYKNIENKLHKKIQKKNYSTVQSTFTFLILTAQ